MPNTHPLLLLLQQHYEKNFQDDVLVSELRVICDQIVQQFDLKMGLLMFENLNVLARSGTATIAAKQLLQDFISQLEGIFTRDPSDYALLYLLALYDLSAENHLKGQYRLEKVASSGYEQWREARRVLSDVSAHA